MRLVPGGGQNGSERGRRTDVLGELELAWMDLLEQVPVGLRSVRSVSSVLVSHPPRGRARIYRAQYTYLGMLDGLHGKPSSNHGRDRASKRTSAARSPRDAEHIFDSLFLDLRSDNIVGKHG